MPMSKGGYRLDPLASTEGLVIVLSYGPVFASADVAASTETAELLVRDGELIVRTPQVYPFGPIFNPVEM